MGNYEDFDDIYINKLRQRKQKFARKGLNNTQADQFQQGINNKNKGNQLNNKNNLSSINQTLLGGNNTQNNSKSSQQQQNSTFLSFDYTGELLQTIKYDTLKFQSHYQDMQFNVHQNLSSTDKNQKKGYRSKKPINMKLVDPTIFPPTSNQGKFQKLTQKAGMVMRQNVAYMLAQGIQLTRGEIVKENKQPGPQKQDQIKQTSKKSLFQFLYNQFTHPNKIKYQQFMKFKRNSQAYALSRKKLSQTNNVDSSNAKKQISLGLTNKLNNINQNGSKVFKNTNAKLLQLLIDNQDQELMKENAMNLNNNLSNITKQMNQNNQGMQETGGSILKKQLMKKNSIDGIKKKVRIV